MRRQLLWGLALLLAMPALGQVEDSTAAVLPMQERSYEREYAEMAQAARAATREQRMAELGRGLRIELAPMAGYVTSTLLTHRADPYHHHAYDAGAMLMVHYPVSRRIDLTAGAGMRFRWMHFSNAVHFNTESLLMEGYPLEGWRSYRCRLTARSLVVPLRFNVVTNHQTSIYLGLTVAYTIGNTFSHSRMSDDHSWQSADELAFSNIECLNTWNLELVAGMSHPLWWIFHGGWELFYDLTPHFDTSIPGTPSVHEFGLRIAL